MGTHLRLLTQLRMILEQIGCEYYLSVASGRPDMEKISNSWEIANALLQYMTCSESN